jgi:DNA polymerase-3 subunit epsilon
LISIAAVGLKVDWPLRRLSIIPADSFEAVLRQEQPSSTQNILLHGIGVARQRNASEPQHALERFVRFAGHAPLLAFHAAFDQGMLVRSIREQLHQTLPNEWVDIEHLCAVTHEQVNARSLDEWMTHFGVTCLARHQASADAFAAAELMCRIWPRVAHQCGSWRQVRALAMQHRSARRATPSSRTSSEHERSFGCIAQKQLEQIFTGSLHPLHPSPPVSPCFALPSVSENRMEAQ